MEALCSVFEEKHLRFHALEYDIFLTAGVDMSANVFLWLSEIYLHCERRDGGRIRPVPLLMSICHQFRLSVYPVASTPSSIAYPEFHCLTLEVVISISIARPDHTIFNSANHYSAQVPLPASCLRDC